MEDKVDKLCFLELLQAIPGCYQVTTLVVHTHVPLSPSSIIWYWPRGGWEGNHRSGVALAMRHRRRGLSTYGLTSLGKGDEHPPTLQEGHGTLYWSRLFTW